MMQGKIDTSFETSQRDLFTSGVAAQIGMNAFGLWLAIKSHADYNTGECWPGMRRLSKLTGLSLGSVSNGVHALIDAKLLRIVTMGSGKRGTKYVARERLDVRLGARVLCTIVLDYVPIRLRDRLREIDNTLKVGEMNQDVFADCEIIPGDGFMWDAGSGVLRTAIRARDVPVPSIDESAASMQTELMQKALALQRKAMKRNQGVDN